MSSISSSFLILGLVLTSVTADETSTSGAIFTDSKGLNSSPANDISSATATPFITTGISTTSSVNSTMNMTDTNSTITPSTTKQTGNETSENGPTNTATKPSPAPGTTTKSMTSTTKTKNNIKDKCIIILVVIIIMALGFGVACYCARNRGRRYSVDFTSRQDDTNIPLSTMEPELPGDAAPQNGLKTFESAETFTKEPEEPETKPEEQSLPQEEPKAEADKSVVDPSAESAAPAPSTESAEDKPKEDAVEQSPPPPVEPSLEEKIDDEGVVSTKTSVESLKETNENNSNNVNQQKDLKLSNLFWDVPLSCPV